MNCKHTKLNVFTVLDCIECGCEVERYQKDFHYEDRPGSRWRISNYTAEEEEQHDKDMLYVLNAAEIAANEISNFLHSKELVEEKKLLLASIARLRREL